MAVTYPLSIPSGLKVVDSSFRLMRVVGESESPFTLETQTYKWPGERWEGEVTLKPMTYAESGAIKAFLAKLRGKHGYFLYGDPDFLARGPNGTAGGTPLVNGASQTGNELITDGWNNGEQVLNAGDFIQLDTGANSELYMVVDDVTSDGSGNATINIEPALKSSPADDEAIVVTGAKGVFKLIDNVIEWNSDKSSITQITLAFKERIT